MKKKGKGNGLLRVPTRPAVRFWPITGGLGEIVIEDIWKWSFPLPKKSSEIGWARNKKRWKDRNRSFPFEKRKPWSKRCSSHLPQLLQGWSATLITSWEAERAAVKKAAKIARFLIDKAYKITAQKSGFQENGASPCEILRQKKVESVINPKP